MKETSLNFRQQNMYNFIPHPEWRLIYKLGMVHLSLGCGTRGCKTLLDAIGHLALLKQSNLRVFRTGRIDVYSGYVYGERSRNVRITNE